MLRLIIDSAGNPKKLAQQVSVVQVALRAFGKKDDNLCPVEYMVSASNVSSVYSFKAIKASNQAVERYYNYYPGGLDGTNCNAFYHAYWNAILLFDIGETKTQYFTNAHEFGKPDNFGDTVSRLKTKMDLINNGVGPSIGSNARDNIPTLIDLQEYLTTIISSRLSEQNTPMRRLDKKQTQLIPTSGDKDCPTYFK